MAKSVDDFNKKRLRSSNITVVISIALVLFLIGLFGLILINAQKYSDYIKEQLVVNAYFDEHLDVKDSTKIAKLNQETFEAVQKLPFVKKATFITQDQAAKEAKKSLGIDSDALFEENIFPASIEVALKPEFVDPAKINGVVKQLSQVQGIKEVKNDSSLTIDVYNNLNRILTWILAFSIIFLVVAIVLINNSIRLKIFSKRFTIKTMQLVGAQRRFILMPFIKEAIILGLIGAVIGLTVLFAGWYYFTTEIGSVFITDQTKFVYLIILVLGVGVLITVLSTIFATWRFLRSRIDTLYYS
ncbi:MULTISPECIES: cell division protein FtsX [Elizabethkingia]|jgi:cell division transport system permease protein|uniref:Cell division protein FtsX n=1 Tax=Elizabethkingia ursingii TaxID=1756150 RepID=A0AAJ3NG79_9FLAO|nr:MULTISPECIES: permease-like cell division protein FtsX [Elizabethkingia]MDR2231226.1 permease-like cell division protein FtsX [Flavobacteriaceae bacterium]AQX07164.1 cell division protein FtsX [Elizabethkingia ursingii]MCL1664997.1 permease-like cell division protein FtsX [Elizabethkingia ursingii]MCL1672216.1 permease-like cell division protein FtsX [Elizabethkingia ursingii]MDX8571349.1 permease-like cell division protein FtsX [Elizabethkingia sp. HX QKY]